MAKVEIKSKEAKMKAAMSGGKAKRKKWSKGKVREKLQNAVQFDQKVLDKMLVEVAKVSVCVCGSCSCGGVEDPGGGDTHVSPSTLALHTPPQAHTHPTSPYPSLPHPSHPAVQGCYSCSPV